MYQIEEVVSTKEKEVMRFFKLEKAPENIPSVAILIGSLYREMNISPASEDTANIYAKELYQKIHSSENIGDVFSNAQLNSLFKSSLSVPTSSAQDKKEKYFLSPFVPSTGSYGLAARNTKGSWNPGGFIVAIIANYSPSEDEFIKTMTSLFNCLKIEGKDPWANLVSNEYGAINEALGIELNEEFDEGSFRVYYNKEKGVKKILNHSKHAKHYFEDLNHIISLKHSLTRQKWIGLFEAYLRLTMFNHIIYTMNLSRSYINLIQVKIRSSEDITETDFEQFLDQSITSNFFMMDVDTKRTSYIESNVRKYCYYNSILDAIIDNYTGERFDDFESPKHFIDFSNHLKGSIEKSILNLDDFITNYKSDNETMLDQISSTYPRTLKNSKECLEYLCQKKATSRSDASPDVNYIFNRAVNKGNSPYLFDLSSGTISTLCCLIFSRINEDQNFMSGVEFVKGLLPYNIKLTIKDISTGKIKNTMQSLGVIIDSPDTEGGVLILRPGWV